MMADKCLPFFPQTKGILEVCSTREQWYRQIEGERNWSWRIATRTPEKLLPTSRHTHDRVIATHMNIPIVDQHRFSDGMQACSCILIVIGNRFFTQIAASHHQCGWSS